LRLNGWSDQNIVLSDSSASWSFYLLKYFHIFTEFIEGVKNLAAQSHSNTTLSVTAAFP
jgi:hypothetical protein